MSFIQAYDAVLNQGPSLAELAAIEVLRATQRTDNKKIELSRDMKSRVHAQWIELKNFLENSGILQIMLSCEKKVVDLMAQKSTTTIDMADCIEELCHTFTKKLNLRSGPQAPSAPIGVYSYCCLHREWEKQALIKLWEILKKQKPELPELITVQDIEEWFEKQENNIILNTIQILDLPYCELRAIPLQILKLSELQRLHLSNNQLTTIPDKICDLEQLKVLHLSGNQLTTIPDKTCDLKQLRGLYLSKNQLTTIPDRICDLEQLQVLDLSGNKLTTIPEWLRTLAQRIKVTM